MIITNLTGLPEAFLNVARFSWYDNPTCDSTTTRLIKPPRMVALFQRYKDQIKVDVQEMAWTLLGGAAHMLLEKAAGENVIVETRIKTNILGWKVSGKPDAYYPERKHIDDFKVTSVFAYQTDKPEWEAQGNLNAMMHRLNNQPVESLQIIAILRDWMNSKARVSPNNYPQHGIQAFGLPIWPQEDCKDFAIGRVQLHQSMLKKSDEELPLCTPEERWYRGEGWAIYKTDGNKRNVKATKVEDTEADAIRWMQEHPIEPPKKGKSKFYAPPEKREGMNIRCLDYCEVREFCDFGKRVRAERQAAMEAKALVNENDDSNDQQEELL